MSMSDSLDIDISIDSKIPVPSPSNENENKDKDKDINNNSNSVNIKDKDKDTDNNNNVKNDQSLYSNMTPSPRWFDFPTISSCFKFHTEHRELGPAIGTTLMILFYVLTGI